MADVPETQTVLVLRAVKQPYQTADGYQVPSLKGEREVLVRTETIGLNPIDWKAPDFNFAIPELPYISGRELVGRVVRRPESSQSRLKCGDQVLVISTDYRDLRKAAYQQYVATSDFNAVRIPRSLQAAAPHSAAGLGVAFVAAALSLGINMGVDFSRVLGGPDLLRLVRSVPPDSLPLDVRDECLTGIRDDDDDDHRHSSSSSNSSKSERAAAGDWIVVWGGSSATANIAVQLARLVGLRVVTVVDKLRHGLRLSNHAALRPDLLVDSHDPSRAVDVIRANVGKDLRFGLDTSGRESAAWLLRALAPNADEAARRPRSPPETPHAGSGRTIGSSSSSSSSSPPSRLKHLVGMTGLPRDQAPKGVVYHTVPIKVFHEVPAVGEALVLWLERLLESGLVSPPEVLAVERGFEGINRGLDRMRRGEIRGGRMVVSLEPVPEPETEPEPVGFAEDGRFATAAPVGIHAAHAAASASPSPLSSPEFTASVAAADSEPISRRDSASLWQAADAIPRLAQDGDGFSSAIGGADATPRSPGFLWQPKTAAAVVVTEKPLS